MNVLKLLRKGFKSDLIEFRNWIIEMYFLWRWSLRMKFAISLANMKQRAINKRYFVMSMELKNSEKLVSINRDDLIRLKRKKWLPKHFSYLDLEREAWYQTDLKRNNTLSKEERAKAIKRYLKYQKSQAKKRITDEHKTNEKMQ